MAAENFRGQFFDRFRPGLGHVARSKLIPQLLRIICSGRSWPEESRDAKFPAIDDQLDRSATLSFGQESLDLEETADVIRVVFKRDRRDFPKFPLWEVTDEAALHHDRAIV